MIELPTVLDNIQCSISTCNKTSERSIPVPYITVHVINGNLSSLEEDIKKRLLVDETSCHHVDKEGNNCRGLKTIKPNISLMHLFIELLNWEGRYTKIIIIFFILLNLS